MVANVRVHFLIGGGGGGGRGGRCMYVYMYLTSR